MSNESAELSSRDWYERGRHDEAERWHGRTEALQAQVEGLRTMNAALLDPIIRQKMCEPSPPIILGDAETAANEREACAEIAEKRLGIGDPGAFAEGVRAAAADIAREIRARGKA
jgi:hypothetical protein